MRVAVFGLGEAGTEIGAGLARAGLPVHGFDPADVSTPPGVTRHDNPRSAVTGADLVLALTAATDAPSALAQALDDIPGAAVYGDCSTASPRLKQQLAASAAEAGVAFADVALMAPVPDGGVGTPALASGPGARRLSALLTPVGVPVEHAGDEPGAAATRKLLRSVVTKGLAAVLLEAMLAASAAGLAEETWRHLVGQLTAADGAFARRLVEGTGRHARRRLHEMEATVAMLDDLGVDPLMTRATAELLRRVDGPAPPFDPFPELPRFTPGTDGAR